MKVKAAYYANQFPCHIVVVSPEGRHFLARNVFQHLQEKDLKPARAWDHCSPAQYFNPIPDYLLPFYGLEIQH